MLLGRGAHAEGHTHRKGKPAKQALHLRLMTPHGPVHVFRPRGYDSSTAGTLVYVHGYYTDLEGACQHHHLVSQFEGSHLNALFISPEAPAGFSQAVRWDNLQELLDAVAASGVEVPAGKVVALAHSGGFRTVVPWLDAGLLDTVVLLDGLYGNEDEFGAWAGVPPHHLVLVGSDTTERIEHFVAGYDDVEEGALPLRREASDVEGSRLIFLRSELTHMELVTEGQTIPEVLRLTSLPTLTVERAAPIPARAQQRSRVSAVQ
jgi:hypothetical protein